MLSRLALRNAQRIPSALQGVQCMTSIPMERVKRETYPSPVRYTFIPEEWFTFFYSKTGVTGPYVFLTTVSTYLVSKEWYVLEHEFYNGLTFLVIWIYGVKKFGPKLADFLDKQLEKQEAEIEDMRTQKIESKQELMNVCDKHIEAIKIQPTLGDILKDGIKVQLEAEYRARIAQAYEQVKKRLDYHVAIQMVERRISQKHMAQWIINNVLKAITPEQEKATLLQCVKDLQALSAKA